MITKTFTRLLSDIIGEVKGGKLTPQQLADADLKINQCFTRPDATPLMEREGKGLKEFIRQDFQDGMLTQRLANFADSSNLAFGLTSHGLQRGGTPNKSPAIHTATPNG